jgi:hypothetical protein
MRAICQYNDERTSGNRNAHLESLSHSFDGPIADQQRLVVWCDVEEDVAVDFTLDRALELRARQPSTGSVGWETGILPVRAGG